MKDMTHKKTSLQLVQRGRDILCVQDVSIPNHQRRWFQVAEDRVKAIFGEKCIQRSPMLLALLEDNTRTRILGNMKQAVILFMDE